MTARRTRLCLLSATIAMLLAVPTSAAAAPYVPPGNSAATQYTEAVPTAGGPKAAGEHKRGKGKVPNKVLGDRNAKRLESRGPEGRATAEVAAATAPPQIDAGSGGKPTRQTTQEGGNGSAQPTGAGGTSSSGHQDAGAASNAGGAAPATVKSSSLQPQSSTSSGLGEVVGQATGASSSNPLGLLLPLLIVAVLVWSVAYFLRHRKRPTG